MKTIFIYLVNVLIVLIFSKCDPDRNTFGTYIATLKADINKISETISLGDTLKFILQWPDVLQTTTLAGDTRTDNVSSLQEAWYAYNMYRIDTINRSVYTKVGDSTKIKFFLSEGYETNPCQPCYVGSVYLQRNTKPYRGVLNLVPQVKGLFYLEVKPQAGPFKINNSFEGLFSVNFNVSNKHYELITPYLGAVWEQGMHDRDNRGFGVYCFRVN